MSDYWKDHTPTCGVKKGDTLSKTIEKYIAHGFPFEAFIAQAMDEYAEKVLEQADELRKAQAEQEKQGKFAIVNCELWICAARSWEVVIKKRKGQE